MTEVINVGAMRMLAERPVAASRSPLLFLHGLADTADTFDHFIEHFAAAGHQCFAPYLRGRRGGAPVADLGRVSLRDYVDDASAAAREVARLSGARPVVIGHSMGGLLAQKLAERGEVAAAVLLAPAPPRGIPVLTWPIVSRMARYLPAMLGSRPFVPRWEDFRVLVFNGFPLDEQRSQFEKLVPDSGRVSRELAFGGLPVDARRVRCPVLVVGGDADRFVPLAVVRRVAARYGASLHVAHGRGHVLPLEPGWADLATFVADWIAAQPADAPSLEMKA